MAQAAVCGRCRGLTPLGFLALQRLPGSGVYYTRVCLTLSVPLTGFLFTLLAAYSSQTLWYRFSGPSVRGVYPLQSFSPFEEPCLSQGLLLSCSSTRSVRPLIKPRLSFRALLPSKSRARGPAITLNPESFLSWGSPALGCSSLPTLLNPKGAPSYAL
jgi:hypothetical protein